MSPKTGYGKVLSTPDVPPKPIDIYVVFYYRIAGGQWDLGSAVISSPGRIDSKDVFFELVGELTSQLGGQVTRDSTIIQNSLPEVQVMNIIYLDKKGECSCQQT